jgi:hypothetical protein
MSEYLLLYSGGKMPESDEEMAEVTKAWTDWMAELGDGLKDGGNPFTPAAESIAADGAVSDGPAGSMASGYSIIKADSLDAAVGMAKGCPVLQGGAQISIFETFAVM